MGRVNLILSLAILAVVCCILPHDVASAKGKGEKGNTKEASKACGSGMLGDLEQCCKNIPRVISKEAFLKCLEQRKEEKNKQTRVARQTGKGRKSGSNKGNGALCLMECVLKQQGLASGDGEPNPTGIKERFLNISDATWKPIVENAVQNCTVEYNNLNKSLLTSNNDTTCKPSAALFMTCMRRYLALSCPDGSIDKTDKTCSKRLQQLQGCDPFVLKAKKSKYTGSRQNKNNNNEVKKQEKKEKQAMNGNKKSDKKDRNNKNRDKTTTVGGK